MDKLYFVRETQFGYTIEGPNGHKWQATTEDGWQRAVAMAKALERAYLEGQKALTSDVDLLVTFELIRTLSDDTDVDATELKSRLKLITSKAAKVMAKIEEAQADNIRENIYRPGDERNNDAGGKEAGTNRPRRTR